jgi:hypothetical protein
LLFDYAFYLWRYFHTWNWHLVYVFCHFSILVNCHLPCVFFNTLRICWHTKKNSMESFHTCLNIVEVGMFFSKLMDKRLPCLYVHGYCKTVVNVSKNNNTIFTNLWILHSIYHHLFSTHDKWMATYKKLTYNLCFSPLFNHNQYCYFRGVSQYIKYFVCTLMINGTWCEQYIQCIIIIPHLINNDYIWKLDIQSMFPIIFCL